MTDQVTPVEASTPSVNQTPAATTNPASEQTTPSLFDSLVGVGKKFKDANELAFGKINADQHIDNLTSELHDLRERNNMLEAEMKKARDMETLIAELKQAREVDVPQATGVETPPSLDIDSIVEKVKSSFDAESKAETAKKNVNEVEEALKILKGQNYRDYVTERANALGMTVPQIVSMMAASPKAAKTLLGIQESKATAPATAPSTINTTASMGSQLSARQARIAEIQALRSTNFSQYLAKQGELCKLQVQEKMGI